MDEQFLPMKKVCELTSLSRTTIQKMADEGEFVRPIQITRKRKVYPRSAVLAWMEAKMEEGC